MDLSDSRIDALAKRVLKWTLVSSTSVLIFCAAGSVWLSRFGAIRGVVDFLQRIVPSIPRVAMETAHSDFAVLVQASQWIFFPVYLGLGLILTRRMFIDDKMKAKLRLGLEKYKLRILILGPLVCMGIGYMLANDFGATSGAGFLIRGDAVVPRARGLVFFRFAFSGDIGLSLFAWIAPIIEAWLILATIACAQSIVLVTRAQK